MKSGSSGSEPKIRVDRTEIQVSSLSSGPVREELVIMNEGKGRLYGSIRSDAPWVTVLDTNLDTTFIQRIALEIRADKVPSCAEAWIHILSTGGIARIKVKLQRPPVPVSTLQMDEKVFQFCGITKGETINFSLTIRNNGPGFLSGTAVPLCDWIEIPARGIWTRTVQVIPVNIITSRAPDARYPVGRIHVRTNGGEETVEVSIHHSPKKGPIARLTPSSLRISWSVRGIIEERLIIRNIGTGTLRGTIPSKYPWISAVPSIFSVEDICTITIRVDTRLLPGLVPASVPIMVITNAGPITLNLEISRAYLSQVKPRIHLPRIKIRSRMTVLDHHGNLLQIIYSGKSGGEGEIWYIEGDDSRCVKVFHPHRCSQEMEEKIQVMQKYPLLTQPGTGICWPTGVVRSTITPSRFIGYIMNRLNSRFSPVHSWYDLPDPDFKSCLQAAGRLAGLVHIVHRSGHCIGDLRENNVFISTSGEISLIDTDSFQVTDPSSSRTWFCKVGTGEYLPPELINGSFEKQNIDRLFADRFALAVLIFRFLMQGAHPYQGRGPLIEDAPTTSDKIIRGLFAYERKIPGLYPPEYAPSYDRIPPAVRALFHEAFVTGHQHPQARPEPERWSQVLGNSKEIVTSPVTIFPTEKKPGFFIELKHPEPEIPEFVDEESTQVVAKNRVVRIHRGEIWNTDRPGYQLLIGQGGFFPLLSCSKSQISLPPSVILPVMMVYQEQKMVKTIRYLIPEIDVTWYVHWHIAADSQSRMIWKGRTFTFRHRIAACRNLLSALLSILRASLTPFSLSPRSVFVGPDSSVRIIAIPQDQTKPKDGAERSILEDTRILLYKMLMNGYHPDHVPGKTAVSQADHFPSPEIIPFPIRRIFVSFPMENTSPEKDLLEWFSWYEQALFSLIPCPVDQDHWYCVIPGFCPFCLPEHHKVFRLVSGSDVRYLSSPVIYLLSAPMQTVRYLKRRSKSAERATIPIILLPFSLTLPYQISTRPFFFLKSRNADDCFLPIRWCRSLPAKKSCVTMALVVASHIYLPGEIPLFPVPILPEISFIDEMRWVSSFEQIKGELLPGRIPRKRQPRQYVQKTVSLMILPGFFVEPEKTGISKVKRRKKVKTGGKLSKTLSDFFDEFFG